MKKILSIMLPLMIFGFAATANAGSHNPCNPCAMHEAANPCNPCAMKAMNPCAMKMKHEKKQNPCAMKQQKMNPCNPCNIK